ncbi:galactose-specific lectin nattectin-like [Halichoeres trimaculatus]|uniref:galactose-specific lectin nattectin-like n=1 Tax=Halichoeres trimaculatus TaxID=147232 RepID=UPI003D9E23AE
MAAGLQVIVLCLISGLWIAGPGECASPKDDCSDPCPPQWSPFNSRCYRYESGQKAWADAERHCTLLGGNLASIRSEAEYDFIRGVVLKAAGRHQESWVGGYDAAKEGVWLWSDGSQFEFKRWAKGEPNNLRGEGCMEINLKGRDFVNDAKCSQEQPFICAKDQ